MISNFHIPVYPLNQYIDYFFHYSGFNPEHSIDRFLPDGEVQLIFDLTDYPKHIYDNYSLKEIQSCKNVWFSGFRTEPITIPSGKESEMLIIQFKKGMAFSFLNEPMYSLTNSVVDAELVFKSQILDIRNELVETSTAKQKFALLESKLVKYYVSRLSNNPFIEYSISKIVSSPEQSSMQDIAHKAGYSKKHIITLFRKYVGVTPKEFLKVIRFQRAIQQIEAQVSVDWSSIAFDCGFYDQSHFIADFKTFSGFTPSEYLRQRGEFLNYIPVK